MWEEGAHIYGTPGVYNNFPQTNHTNSASKEINDQNLNYILHPIQNQSLNHMLAANLEIKYKTFNNNILKVKMVALSCKIGWHWFDSGKFP